MQCLTDVLNTPVTTLGFEDVSALGAAYMAGLGCGVFVNIEHLQRLHTDKQRFTPGPHREQVEHEYQAWERSLKGLLGTVS